jgi:protein gp37
MGEKTAISWTDHTFNPWIGCTKLSQGCARCYAESQNKRYNWTAGWGKGAPRRRTSESNWNKPIQWAKQAVKDGVARRVFCASLADIYDPEVPQEWRDDLWQLIWDVATGVNVYALEWLILTKRPENIERMTPKWIMEGTPRYIRLGVTAEDQENANRRIPALLNIWQGKTFVSFEPLLTPIKFRIDWLPVLIGDGPERFPGIDWCIVGGESGANCRPMGLDWARYIRDRCKESCVPFFFKQIGGNPNKRHNPAEWPEDLRIQEFPRG